MLALLAALALAAPPAADKPAPEPKAAPLTAEQAVDANGVPAWAKRKRRQFVQNCPAQRPNIGIQTWRDRYQTTDSKLLKPPRTATVTCK